MKPLLLVLMLALAAGAGAQSRRDPFARPVGAAAADATAEEPAPVAPPPPRLRAVMYEPGKSLVNINGRILAVGDSYEDYRVAAIGERSATLIRRGIRSVIVIDEESSK